MAMQGWQSDGGKDKIAFYNSEKGHGTAETTDHPFPRMHKFRAVIYSECQHTSKVKLQVGHKIMKKQVRQEIDLNVTHSKKEWEEVKLINSHHFAKT